MNCPKCGKPGIVIIPLAPILMEAAKHVGGFLAVFLRWGAGAVGAANLLYHSDCGYLAIKV